MRVWRSSVVSTSQNYGIRRTTSEEVEGSGVVEEQTAPRLQALVEPASQTVLWVNGEFQNPPLHITEFVRSKRQEGWDVLGIAPKGVICC
jgi:hypothetical protein